MRLLVFGGTAFLSHEVCRLACEQGHDVSAIARGTADAPPVGVTWIRGDRRDPDVLQRIHSSRWDAVIDVGMEPGQVRQAARAMRGVTDRYVFISSISAYADRTNVDGAEMSEADSTLMEPLEAPEMAGPHDYGPAKVACEQHVVAAIGAERSLIVRPGLIGGPGDTSGRSAYWPQRFAQPANPSGAVVVPCEEDRDPWGHTQPLQLIDVRDAATFIVMAAEAGEASGAVDLVGPASTLGAALSAARDVAGAEISEPLGTTTAWLQSQGVQAWAGPYSLPLWLAGDESAYPMLQRRGARARELGLTTRDLRDTFADELGTLAADFLRQQPPSGLSDEEHRELVGQAATPSRPPDREYLLPARILLG